MYWRKLAVGRVSDVGPGAKPVSHRDPRGGLGEL